MALGEPPEGVADLDGFPTASASGTWCRAHTTGYGPWWFASGGEGRFDLATPDGTCYLASDVEGAVRERLGGTLARRGMVLAAEADRMAVSRLEVDVDAADATARGAAGFGITRELGAMVPYDLPQRWATALHRAGHQALRYWPRFSNAADMTALALFGTSGADGGRSIDVTPMSGRDACRAARIAVIGLPRDMPTIEPN